MLLLYGKVVKNEVLEVNTDEVKQLKEEIKILSDRLKKLNDRLVCCRWVETNKQTFDVVDIEIDKEVLTMEEEEGLDKNYIGKAFAIEFIGNKKYFKSIYFKKSELKEVYKK